MLGHALEGIRVIDFTQIASGPTCTLMLADLGADVIKIEAKEGDVARSLGPPWIDGTGVFFMALNRNKRSVVTNLKDPRERDRILDLIAQSDVVVENFRPGVMRRLGLSYDDVRNINPQIVYCSISGFGQTGSWKNKGGVDGVVQALSGLMGITGEKGGGPVKVQVPIVDIVTGFLAANSIQAALHAKARHGKGQYLDISMLSSALMLQQTAFAAYLQDGQLPERCGSAAPYAAPNEAFPTADGWIMIVAYHQDRWAALCTLLNVEHLIHDPRFHSLANRVANRPEMIQELSAKLRERSTAHWLECLGEADVLCAPIATYTETLGLSPVQDAGVLVDVPVEGTDSMIRQIGCALSTPAPAVRRGAPAIGQHTAEVLDSRAPSLRRDTHSF